MTSRKLQGVNNKNASRDIYDDQNKIKKQTKPCRLKSTRNQSRGG